MLILCLSEDDVCRSITLYLKEEKKKRWKIKSRNQTKSFSCIYSTVVTAKAGLLLSFDICSCCTRKVNTYMWVRDLRALGTFRSERQEQACPCYCSSTKNCHLNCAVFHGGGRIKTLGLHGQLGITMSKTAWPDPFFAGLHPGDQYMVIT